MSIQSSGIVRRYIVARGYGFIAPDDNGPDVFVHCSAVVAAGMRILESGMPVSFDIAEDRKGRPIAVNLSLRGGR